MPSRAEAIVSPYLSKAAVSASGSPSRSVITAIGSGAATSWTRSNDSRVAAVSRRLATRFSIISS